MFSLNTQFHYWTVIDSTPRKHPASAHRYYLCRCQCGVERTVSSPQLRSGKSKSCGCYRDKVASDLAKKRIKHGHTRNQKPSRIYRIWVNMKTRCNNKKTPTYPRYGGRGIKVCDRWTVFNNFLHDMGEPPTVKHSIDRIDNNKGYYLDNCKWSTPKEQARNTRKNQMLEFRGETKTMSDWSQHFNLHGSKLRDRINKLGWTIERALTTP